jgi:hypothetical protein
MACSMWANSPRKARALGRLGGGELQHHAEVVGQLVRAQQQAGLLVGLDQVDHGRAAVARVAVHMLEQVQRGAAAAVEQVDVLGFHVQAVLARQAAHQGVQRGPAGRAQRGLVGQGLGDLAQVGAQLGVG